MIHTWVSPWQQLPSIKRHEEMILTMSSSGHVIKTHLASLEWLLGEIMESGITDYQG